MSRYDANFILRSVEPRVIVMAKVMGVFKFMVMGIVMGRRSVKVRVMASL